MRYISAPHRSHSVLGSAVGATRIGDTGRAGGRGGVGSDIEADYFTDAATAANQAAVDAIAIGRCANWHSLCNIFRRFSS
jgi:hypothetical protein